MTRTRTTVGFAILAGLLVGALSAAAFAPPGFARAARAQTDDASAGRTVRAHGQGVATMPAESLTVRFVFGSAQYKETGPEPITEAQLQPVIDALIGIGVDAGTISVVAMPGMYGPPGALALQVVVAQPTTEWVQQIVDTGSNAAVTTGLSMYEVGGRFSVSDCGPLVAQAHIAAVQHAQQQADAWAAALEVTLSEWTALAGQPHFSDASNCQTFKDPYSEQYFPPIDLSRPMEAQVTVNAEVTFAVAP